MGLDPAQRAAVVGPESLIGLQQINPTGEHVFVGAANRNFLLNAFHRDVRVFHALNGMKVHDVAAVNTNEAVI